MNNKSQVGECIRISLVEPEKPDPLHSELGVVKLMVNKQYPTLGVLVRASPCKSGGDRN